MNKFNLLAEPYSMEQLAAMIDHDIAAAKEAYAGMEAVQAELHEAEHSLELLSCQLNMLTLVADKPGALEALNANGALESLCNKKIEEITSVVAVESLGEKIVAVIKWIWEKIKELCTKAKEFFGKAFSFMKRATVVDGKVMSVRQFLENIDPNLPTVCDNKPRNILSVKYVEGLAVTLTKVCANAGKVVDATKKIRAIIESYDPANPDRSKIDELTKLGEEVSAIERHAANLDSRNADKEIDLTRSGRFVYINKALTLREAGLKTVSDVKRFLSGPVFNPGIEEETKRLTSIIDQILAVFPKFDAAYSVMVGGQTNIEFAKQAESALYNVGDFVRNSTRNAGLACKVTNNLCSELIDSVKNIQQARAVHNANKHQ